MSKTFIYPTAFNEWIFDTYRKHGVNVYTFCYEWAHSYFDHPEKWPKGHKKKSDFYDERPELKEIHIHNSLLWEYDYKQKSNLFGLDGLYRGMPKKSFIKGKKQELEAIIMYCWLHGVTRDDDYWEEYSQNVL